LKVRSCSGVVVAAAVRAERRRRRPSESTAVRDAMAVVGMCVRVGICALSIATVGM
jgi:hypothetical protein